MINFHLLISAPFRKLRRPRTLPVVDRSEAESIIWFHGYWHGIGLGIVLGLGSAVIAGWIVGIVQ